MSLIFISHSKLQSHKLCTYMNICVKPRISRYKATLHTNACTIWNLLYRLVLKSLAKPTTFLHFNIGWLSLKLISTLPVHKEKKFLGTVIRIIIIHSMHTLTGAHHMLDLSFMSILAKQQLAHHTAQVGMPSIEALTRWRAFIDVRLPAHRKKDRLYVICSLEKLRSHCTLPGVCKPKSWAWPI